MQKQFKAGVSLIICCYNSEKIIKKPLKAILGQQTNIQFELIIVDNNCTDSTVDFVKKTHEENNSNIYLTIVEESRPGISHARKRGFSEAKYSYISFIDDDNIVNKNWVNVVYALFHENPEIGILGSSNKALFLNNKEPEWFNKVKEAYACDIQGGDLEELTTTRKYVYGAGMCIRREALAEIYGIVLPFYLSGRRGSKLLSGDDSELGMRAILLGYKMYCSNKLKIKHIMPKERLTWSYFRKMSEGHSRSSIILQIYGRLINNNMPLTRQEIVKTLIKDWWEYIKTYKFRYINQPNSISSKKYISLKGRTVGIIDYFNTYDEIVHKVVNVFEPKSKLHET